MAKRKLEQLGLLFIMLFMVTTNAWSGSDYYSKVSVTTNDADKGKVYVSYKDETNSLDYKSESTAESGKDTQQNAPTHTYYLYTQPQNKYILSGLSGYDESKIIRVKDNEYAISITAQKETPSEANITASFDLLPTNISTNRYQWSSDNTGNIKLFQEGVIELYAGDGVNAEGRVLYQKLTGLKNGHYTLTFKAAASAAQWKAGVTAGEDIAEAYVIADNKDDANTLDIINRTQKDNNISDYVPIGNEFTVNVTDGTLEYGVRIKEGKQGGNWFTCEPISLEYLDVDANLAISSAKWGTFCAPFDVEIPEGVTAYTAIIGEDNEIEKTEVSGTTMKANVPYLVYSEEVYSETFTDTPVLGEVSDEYALKGNIGEPADLEANGECYVLQLNGGKVGFYQVQNEGMKIGTNRCYLHVPATSNVKAFYSLDAEEETTGLQSINSERTNDAIYDMSGRRVNAAQKGLYIMGGKKVLVK